jgi:glyoxylase-like metal-dependent hydrolase (beta-lactamase superfamily II)
MPLFYDGEVRIFKVRMGPFGNNGYIIACPETGEAVIIDAPAEPRKLLREAKGLTVKALLITHAHRDHLLGLAEMERRTGAPLAAHPLEVERLPRSPDILLRDGDTLEVGKVRLQVLHTPGHTPGAVCFLTGRHLFSGDTLFPGGPGKTRTPEAFRQIVESITTRLLPLPEDTIVYPGHGDETTIGRAREEYNAFASRPHPPDLCGDVEWLKS